MSNMPRALMDKVDNMQEQLGNVIRDGKSKKESKRTARDQKFCKRNEIMSLMGSSVVWTWLRKEPLSLRICQ